MSRSEQTTVTRKEFLRVYQEELKARDTVGWTRKPEEMRLFMERVEGALNKTGQRWSPTSSMARAASRRLGLGYTPTLKMLQALPLQQDVANNEATHAA